MDKKRILILNEFSRLSTGFSGIGNEVIKYLYNTGKYEVAELGTYLQHNDPRQMEVPWKVYPGIPSSDNQYASHFYNTVQTGQFGEAVFEQVCLDFKPNICISILDLWMNRFQLYNSFRNKYKLLWMPTVDGAPQQIDWLDCYNKIDKLLVYSRFGKETLESENPDKFKLTMDDVVRPGVNPNIYKPLNKQELRDEFGIPQDANVIVSLMRNQKRKLFPDLMEMFAKFLKVAPPEIAKKSYLYVHSSYPDVGYNFCRDLIYTGIAHRTYFTYTCARCRKFYPDFFRGELAVCKYCGALAAHMPNTQMGISQPNLAKVLNLCDLYIQYSISEGFAMPLAEAKACGLPAFAVDYSAMSEQVEIEGCQKIRVERFFHEAVIETEQSRALPDNDDCVEKAIRFFQADSATRQKWSELARKDAAENYNFDRAAKIFERAIDELHVSDIKGAWEDPTPNYAPKRQDIPGGLSNTEFVEWCMDNVLGESRFKDSYWKHELVKGLNVGYIMDGAGKTPGSHKDVFDMFNRMADRKNYWEKQRLEMFKPKDSGIKWRLI